MKIVMSLNYKEYNIHKEYKGNENNRIFLVSHKTTNKLFVLKVINIRKEKKNQMNEILIHEKLSHKYIIQLIDYKIEGNQILILLEHAKHGDLFSLLPKLHELSQRKILKIFYKVLCSLAFLHSKGIIHRDIKPENILIGKNLRPKLADFGISKNMGSIRETFCGTIEYMAPEFYSNVKKNYKVDVWAIGILLFEIFHRRTPFKGKKMYEVNKIISKRQIPFKDGIDPRIIDFIYLCLQIKPENRPDISVLLKHPLFNGLKKKINKSEEASNNIKNERQNVISSEIIDTERKNKHFNEFNSENSNKLNLRHSQKAYLSLEQNYDQNHKQKSICKEESKDPLPKPNRVNRRYIKLSMKSSSKFSLLENTVSNFLYTSRRRNYNRTFKKNIKPNTVKKSCFSQLPNKNFEKYLSLKREAIKSN